MKYEKTGRMLIEEFKAELGYLKRYPKKETDKKSHNPIRCIKIPLSFFPREEEDVEIFQCKTKINTVIKKFYGPPGTGKTEKLIRRALAYIRIGTPVKKNRLLCFY